MDIAAIYFDFREEGVLGQFWSRSLCHAQPKSFWNSDKSCLSMCIVYVLRDVRTCFAESHAEIAFSFCESYLSSLIFYEIRSKGGSKKNWKKMLSTSRNFLIDSNIKLWLETALGDQVRFQGCVFSRVTQLLSVFSAVSKLFCVFSTVTHLLSVFSTVALRISKILSVTMRSWPLSGERAL